MNCALARRVAGRRAQNARRPAEDLDLTTYGCGVNDVVVTAPAGFVLYLSNHALK